MQLKARGSLYYGTPCRYPNYASNSSALYFNIHSECILRHKSKKHQKIPHDLIKRNGKERLHVYLDITTAEFFTHRMPKQQCPNIEDKYTVFHKK